MFDPRHTEPARIPETGGFPTIWIPFLLRTSLLLAAAALSSHTASAGVVVVENVLDLKGVNITITKTQTIVYSQAGIALRPTDDPNQPFVVEPIIIPNDETVEFSASIDYLYNLYEKVIDVPEPQGVYALLDSSQPVDFFDVMVANTGSGIGPLPAGSVVSSAAFHPGGASIHAQITPLSDLADLPTSTSNDLNIVWDLSSISTTTGDFYLEKFTVPVNLLFAPEPGSFYLFIAAALVLVIRRFVVRLLRTLGGYAVTLLIAVSPAVHAGTISCNIVTSANADPTQQFCYLDDDTTPGEAPAFVKIPFTNANGSITGVSLVSPTGSLNQNNAIPYIDSQDPNKVDVLFVDGIQFLDSFCINVTFTGPSNSSLIAGNGIWFDIGGNQLPGGPTLVSDAIVTPEPHSAGLLAAVLLGALLARRRLSRTGFKPAHS